uniref:PDZ domain-containing protein n=1 Tax=Malurus cyaneus samueli TaxID=2593467 RepID=A0A8C5TDX8_9PASS
HGAGCRRTTFPVVFLRSRAAAWSPHERVYHPDYNNELTQFLPRTIVLKKPPGAQLGFNIRGGKASQLGIFISKVIPDSDAHRAGLQEGTVLSVTMWISSTGSKAVEILKTAREITMRVRYFPYSKCPVQTPGMFLGKQNSINPCEFHLSSAAQGHRQW